MKKNRPQTKMSKIIEGVGLSGCLCVLDGKPKKVSTCLSCQLDVCDIPSMRSRLAGIFKTYENEYHVTDAIGPPLITKFKRENPYYVYPDSLMPMFIGTAVHEKIEEDAARLAHSDLGDHEVRGQYDFGPFKLVGTMDYVNRSKKLILDYKCLGAWKTRQLLDKAAKGEGMTYCPSKHPGDVDEYFWQLNVYRAAFYPEAETLRLHVFLKDFSGNAQRMYKLDRQEYRVNVPLYGIDESLDMVRANIEESLKDEPRNCTPEECWQGLRCKKFCPNYTCFNYEGPQCDVKEVE